MIYLSESALKYAVNICEELSNYKVGIVLSSKKKKKKKKKKLDILLCKLYEMR